MQQHPRRKAGVILVKGGFEAVSAGRGDEVHQHGDCAPIQPQRQPFQPPCRRRARQRLFEQCACVGSAGESRSARALPSRGFEREEFRRPFRQPCAAFHPIKGQHTCFGQPVMLTAQFLALFRGHRRFEVGCCLCLPRQQGAAFLGNGAGRTARSRENPFQCNIGWAIGGQLGQVQKQRTPRPLVKMGEHIAPKRVFVPGSDQRRAAERIGVEPAFRMGDDMSVVFGAAHHRQQPGKPPLMEPRLGHHPVSLAPLLQRGQQKPRFVKGVGFGGGVHQPLPRGEEGRFAHFIKCEQLQLAIGQCNGRGGFAAGAKAVRTCHVHRHKPRSGAALRAFADGDGTRRLRKPQQV